MGWWVRRLLSNILCIVFGSGCLGLGVWVWVSGCLGVWVSGLSGAGCLGLGVWVSGCLGVWVFESLGV